MSWNMVEDDYCRCANENCIRSDCARHKSHMKPGIYTLSIFCPDNDYQNCPQYFCRFKDNKAH